jgi:hypothetical protein
MGPVVTSNRESGTHDKRYLLRCGNCELRKGEGATLLETPKLSIKASAVEAIKLPFINFREFVRFSCVPIALTLPVQLLSLFVLYHSATRSTASTVFKGASIGLQLIIGVISVPFSVAWIRLAVNGARSVSHRSLYAFGVVERRFLFSSIIVGLAIVFLLGGASIPTIAGVFSYRSRSALFTAIVLLLGVMLLVVGLLLSIRAALIPVAVALQRYAGLRVFWRVSKGMGFREIGVVLLAILPFSISQGVAGALQGYFSRSGWIILAVALNVISEYLLTAAWSGSFAIIYRSSTSSSL